jgi:hypothetical protein
VRKDKVMNLASNYTKQEIEEIVVMVRLELYNRCLPCGAEKVRKKIEDAYHVLPLPSRSTISRILSRKCLTLGRTGWYAEDYPEVMSHGLKEEG